MLKALNSMQKVSVFLALIFLFLFMLIMLPVEIDPTSFMYVPVTAALITMLLTGEAFSKEGWRQLGFHRFSFKSVLVGFLIPLIPIIVGFAIIWGSGLAEFGLAEEFKGQELVLAISFVMTLIVSSLTVTLGEEAGWRGYLSAKLQQLGFAKSLLLNGFIWGLFHLPIMLLTDSYHGDMNPYLYIPMFVVTATLAGAFITYLRYRSGSIWPAIIAHTSHNLAWNYGDIFTQNADPVTGYMTGDSGVVLILFYAAVLVWILLKGKRPAGYFKAHME
ncbi:CPBP family intramembrane glutamic endopeptidase [Paenibacillus nanensis]|nr:CPBP family intramembrane glutamic endopeptidase [Paenibacillus nanensis]